MAKTRDRSATAQPRQLRAGRRRLRTGELFYPKADSEFHTYGLYWAPEDLIFYIDSKPVYRVHDPAHIPNTPSYVLFNVALGQNMWGKGPMKRNPTSAEIDAGMPNTMQIDYFRVYSGTIDP